MPRIRKRDASRYHRQGYPGRLRARTEGCWKYTLSDAGGLTQFGAGEVELEPGASSSLCHWHQNEDEFVYVLEGEVVMIEGAEEYVLGPGDSATFKAGVAVGHSFENRSKETVRLLEVGTRHPDGETAHYPGLDMRYRKSGAADGYRSRFERLNGDKLAKSDEVDRLEDSADPKPPSPLDID